MYSTWISLKLKTHVWTLFWQVFSLNKTPSTTPPSPAVLSITYSFLSSERPVCQQCSGSIPKVNKLTHGAEWIVDGLPPSGGQSEWSVLFGQLSRGEMSGLRRPAPEGRADGQTEAPKELEDKQKTIQSRHLLSLLLDWNNEPQCAVVDGARSFDFRLPNKTCQCFLMQICAAHAPVYVLVYILVSLMMGIDPKLDTQVLFCQVPLWPVHFQKKSKGEIEFLIWFGSYLSGATAVKVQN